MMTTLDMQMITMIINTSEYNPSSSSTTLITPHPTHLPTPHPIHPPQMSDWDRFAAEEYELLVAEEGNTEPMDDM